MHLRIDAIDMSLVGIWAGVVVGAVGIVVGLLVSTRRKRISQKQNAGAGSSNFQAGGDINIGPPDAGQ
jgi:hypothetical protein